MSSASEIFASLLEEQVELMQKQISRLRGESVAIVAVPSAVEDTDDEKPVKGKPGRKPKKVKAPVDPNKPKQPLSNYMLFSQELMTRYRQQDPSKPTSELMKLIGAQWKTIDADKKAKYTEAAQALRTDYDKKLTAYTATLGPEAVIAAAAVKSKKDAKKEKAASAQAPATVVKEKVKDKTPKKSPVSVSAPVAIPIATPGAAGGSEKKKKKRKHHEKDAETPAAAGAETEKKKKHKKNKHEHSHE